MNTGDVSLTVFELLTATFAADDFNLRQDWEKRERELRRHTEDRDGPSPESRRQVEMILSWVPWE